MDLADFAKAVSGFSGLSHSEKIKHLGWYLHTKKKNAEFKVSDIRSCYNLLHLDPPANLTRSLDALTEKKPPELLKKTGGMFRLHANVRALLDAKYGDHETVIIVSQMLADLPGKVTDAGERLFLTEALRCYQIQAFRAAIVMTWNVAYDHLLGWIMADAKRLADFNAAIPKKYPKKTGLVMNHREGFEELREFELIEVCGTASLFSGNVKKILNDKLTKRNMAAHPSLIEITRAQADDTITDLVNNIILKLV